MKVKKVHCLFEQSGTFKNEFIKLGIPAEDYDILNDFGQTDHIVDLFAEIRGGYNGESSIFNKFDKDDLIVAFFPCTRFEAKISLGFRGEMYQQKNWDTVSKLKYSMKLHEELHELYELISMMVCVCIEKELRLIIENPYTQPHYLTTYWCIRPTLIDHDRSQNGDYYKKPTQYWFVNCEPETNFIFEPIENVETYVVDGKRNRDDISKKVERSLMHPQYANRFIRQKIIDDKLSDLEVIT